MSKVMMIVAQQGFRDEELFVPKQILEKAGHTVKVASLLRSKATGSKGAIITTDMAISEANPDYFDLIVVVGGPGSAALSENQTVLSFMNAVNIKKKKIAAICLGPMALARSGVLGGVEATVFPSAEGITTLKSSGALYTSKKIVVTDRIITADSPEMAHEFGDSLVRMLKK
ncbi:DJ-1/PfpI family protein [Candidatus Micrarchaeota archaeon]|nr:DJ-1/PfpI family protein [Candidatus Micrarchaeota archaeon]